MAIAMFAPTASSVFLRTRYLSSSTAIQADVNLSQNFQSFVPKCAGSGRSRRWVIKAMAPDDEKMTRRSPLDFPVEWDRPSPGRRPDIFPQFSPMKTPLPPPLPTDPPEEDEEEEEKKDEEPEKEPEKPDE